MTDLEKLAAETLATWMHHQYQRIAQEEGWQVQPNTAGEFDDLPEANKRVMVRVAADVRKLLVPTARAAGRIEGLKEAAQLCRLVRDGLIVTTPDTHEVWQAIRARIQELKK